MPAVRSNTEILEIFQSKVLQIITNAPWYMPTTMIAHDFHIITIKEEITESAQKYEERQYPNSLAKNLME